MQRNFLRGFLICLIPCLVAAVFAAPVRVEKNAEGKWEPRVTASKYRLGIDLAGGTILVYEVNLARTQQRKELLKSPQERNKDKEQEKGKDATTPGETAPVQGLTSEEINALAAQIKRRIDPTDIKNVTVRPSGDRRIEIILPTGGETSGRTSLTNEEIEEVKRLISQMGVLEFRILANGPDDNAGILAAVQTIDVAGKDMGQWVDPRKQLANSADAKLESATRLQILASEGKPPPAPEDEFPVDINDTKAMVRYAWVELGPEERESLGLSNFGPDSRGLKRMLLSKLNQAVADNGDFSTCTMLLYARECVNAERLTKEKETAEKLKAEQAKVIQKGKEDGLSEEKIKEQLVQLKLSDEQIPTEVNRKQMEYFVLTRISDLDTLRVGGEVTLTASAGQDRSNNPAVDFTFNGAGARQFGAITRRNKVSNSVKRSLAIILDEKVVSAPGLESEITDRGQIHGKFSKESVDRLVHILRSGALSAELREKPVSENMIGPTLGEDTIHRGLYSIALAFVAVLVFMVIYYRFAGFVASVALFANLLLTIGFMVAVNAAFTLPGLAGLVLTLGMAVDANVLIYERLREERNKGANIATAIRNGYDRAFLTIIDTHLTSIFTAIVLYTLGNDNLKGFAISLTVGLVISLFTSLYMTRLMFDFWLHKRWLTELKMMRLFEKPNFNPMKFRWFFFPFTAALTIGGLALFFVRGNDSLNVDFRGGTVYSARMKEGEERGLTKTSDGKLGYRELLSPERQAELLAVEKVTWENEASGPEANTWVYTITYKDGSKQTVTLTEKPGVTELTPNPTKEQMAEDVARRAGQIPDISVEQTYTRDEDPTKGSKRFTIRTTEKQKELVEASLDRLMREKRDGKEVQLLDGATMTVSPFDNDPKEGPGVTLTFDKPTSPTFVAELFKREFDKLGSGISSPKMKGLDTAVEGRHKVMRLNTRGITTFEGLGDPKAPDHAKQQQSFNDVVARVKQAFDSKPEPERLEVFDSQLAKDTREKALFAIVVSWIMIVLYLWFRFGNWTFGLAAVICLVHDLCFTLGAIAVCHYLHLIPGLDFLGIEDFKIDLTAVAALLTLVGYSVNEIIVNFARVREVRGKNPKLTPEMINDSVNGTLSRTILTAMTVFLVSIVLYAFGGEGVHLFAFVMVMGVMVATYSSIFVACPLLLFLGEGHDTAGTTTEEQAAEEKDKEETSSEQEVVEG